MHRTYIYVQCITYINQLGWGIWSLNLVSHKKFVSTEWGLSNIMYLPLSLWVRSVAKFVINGVSSFPTDNIDKDWFFVQSTPFGPHSSCTLIGRACFLRDMSGAATAHTHSIILVKIHWFPNKYIIWS